MSQGANNRVHRPSTGESERERLHTVRETGEIALDSSGNGDTLPLIHRGCQLSQGANNRVHRPSTGESERERLHTVRESFEIPFDLRREFDGRPLRDRVGHLDHARGCGRQRSCSNTAEREFHDPGCQCSKTRRQITWNGNPRPFLDRIGQLTKRNGNLGYGACTETGKCIQQRTKGCCAQGAGHGGKASSDFIPVEFGEFTECCRDIDKTLRGKSDRSRAHKAGDSGQGACRS